MRSNFPPSLDRVLVSEGGFVDNKKDPGGATNKGITIGTLKQLHIDVDGDGDSDIADLKSLRRADVEKVYKTFYWDAVRADLLPSGLDYAVFDFAVNSGPARAVMKLQSILCVTMDGDIGPATLAKIATCNQKALITAYAERRLSFMREARHSKTHELLWPEFGKGWQRRVDEVTAAALKLAA